MKKIILLLGFLGATLMLFGVPDILNGEPDILNEVPGILNENSDILDKVPDKKNFPEINITGYEEDVLLLCLNPVLNSVENFDNLEKVLSQYVNLSDIKIERSIKPEKIIKILDKSEKMILKDKDLDKLTKYEEKLYSLYKIKIKDKKIKLNEFEKKLKQERNIIYAQKNFYYQVTYEPNDPAYVNGHQWGITASKFNDAWDYSMGEDVLVAVVDTGLDYTHPDIVDNLWINPEGYCGYDFSDEDDDPMDYSDHGTMVCGVIAAVSDNNMGIAGAASRVRIMAVKVFPNATSEVLAAGLKYAADYGADIINNSWGPKYRRPEDAAVSDAIDYAFNADCTIVFSAGNANDDAAYYFGANHPLTISVAAVDEELSKTNISNFGEVIDIAAPGNNIYTFQPGGSYQYFSGTSAAAPFVTAAAALLKSNNPALTNTEIRQIFTDSAQPLDEPLFYSAGFLDAYAAITGVSPTPEPPPTPVIVSIPPIDEGMDITIIGESFTDESQVIIQGDGVYEYCTIISRSTDTIVLENEYTFGTYEITVMNDEVPSNDGELIINYVPPENPPVIGMIPDVEEEEEIIILGDDFTDTGITVRITGEGIDEEAEIVSSCKTAIIVVNNFLPGDYTITAYNRLEESNAVEFTLYELGMKPEPEYNIINGYNPVFNWLNGTYKDDMINGNNGTDYITGYGGNDLISGGNGSDVFIYGAGHGIDTITDSSGTDSLITINIDAEDITPFVDGLDYILFVPNGMIRIKDQFVSPNSSVEYINIWF
ncbi:MAG: S8 family serine peptidase [Spirochaetales bacterium]|nr:S8 family serine peptidase [Spirochaetales bacterium]